MFETSLDVLYMSLAIGFIILVIFLSILIFYAILVLRDSAKMIDNVEQIVNRIHKTIIQPLRAVDYIMETISPYVQAVVERKVKAKKKGKK